VQVLTSHAYELAYSERSGKLAGHRGLAVASKYGSTLTKSETFRTVLIHQVFTMLRSCCGVNVSLKNLATYWCSAVACRWNSGH
jgi:hypothetical protein